MKPLKQPDGQGLELLLVELTELSQAFRAWDEKMEVLEANKRSLEQDFRVLEQKRRSFGRAIRDFLDRVEEVSYRLSSLQDENQELHQWASVWNNNGRSVADAIERDYAIERGIRQE